MERKLATIRRIAEIKPILNADMIEICVVDGWQCVTKKGQFSVGDVGCYFEIDSFLPMEDRYLFLKHKRKNADGTEGYRLKTAKFRGTLSQGLMLPLTEFKDKLHNPVLGADVGETLGIKKFEIPIPAHLAGLVKGALPAFIHKTDQERIQNLPDYFTQHRDIKFELSEKVDGTSCSYFLNNGEFGVCSRNLELKESEGNTYWKVARDIDIEAKLRTRNMNIGIQGEILGEGINGNPLKLKGHHYLVFDVWDIDHSCYLNPLACRSLCKVMELEHVPVIDPEQAVFQTRDTMEKMLDYASGKSMLNPEVEREGIVFKSSEGDISFKVVSISYLLKEKE